MWFVQSSGLYIWPISSSKHIPHQSKHPTYLDQACQRFSDFLFEHKDALLQVFKPSHSVLDAAPSPEAVPNHEESFSFALPAPEAVQEDPYSFAPSTKASDLFPTSIAAESDMEYI